MLHVDITKAVLPEHHMCLPKTKDRSIAAVRRGVARYGPSCVVRAVNYLVKKTSILIFGDYLDVRLTRDIAQRVRAAARTNHRPTELVWPPVVLI